MTGTLAASMIQWMVYVLEVYLVWYLFSRGQWKKFPGLLVYLTVFLVTDALARPYFLYKYGVRSYEYAHCYWSTDFLLEVAAFSLICYFFKRAFTRHNDLSAWLFVRRLLGLAFVIVLAVSAFSIWGHYSHLSQWRSHLFQWRFVAEFQQNLYFACLVLNTLLYLTVQHLDIQDEKLGMLVCGMGIQYAGPAASLALVHLTSGQQYSNSLVQAIIPLCSLGMLVTWFYAVGRMSASEQVPEGGRSNPGGISTSKAQVAVSKA